MSEGSEVAGGNDRFQRIEIAKQISQDLDLESVELARDAEIADDLVQSQGKQRIVKVLAPAVRLWIKTQVDAVEELTLDIQSGDRALLSGKIEQVRLEARGVVYKGLHIGFVSVTASNIQINLGQVLRGKPLRLLEPIPVQGAVQLDAADLNASVEADLLANALTELLSNFLRVGLTQIGTPPLKFSAPHIQLGTGQVILRGTLLDAQQQQQSIGIQAPLMLSSSQELRFHNLAWLPEIPTCDRKPETWQDITIDLGPDVKIHHLSITEGELACRASLTILP